MKILFIFISFELSKREKELDRDSKKIKRMKRAWSLIFVWLWEIWNKEALFGKRRAESSSNRHWLPTFWSCCFIKFILVSMLNCCSFFLQPFSIYLCWEITLVLLHTVCVCHILFLYPSGWYIAIVVVAVGCRPVRILLVIIFPFLLIALALTLNADGRCPKKKNTIANVMRSNLLRRNCFSNKIPYRNNFWNSLCVLSPCVCPKTKRYYN